MKIIVAGYGHGATMIFDAENVGSGWENLCVALDSPWYSIDEAWNVAADAVLYIGTHPSVRELARRGGKPDNWRRCLMLQEAGISALNDAGHVADVFRANFDGFLAYSLVSRFEVFGKPVFDGRNAYPFHKHPGLWLTRREHKVMLYLHHYRDPAADALGTLAMFRRLDARGITFVEPSIAGDLRALLNAAGLGERVVVRDATSWPEFLAELATCKVAASMDSRQTWGRLDLDCALAGIKCIGPYTAAKGLLFPGCIASTVDECAALTQRELVTAGPRYPLRDDIVRDFSLGAVAGRIRSIVAGMQ